MSNHRIQTIELGVTRDAAFAYIANPATLPLWANAFAAVEGHRARLRTPAGELDITLHVDAVPNAGTVDWRMIFPDGSTGLAHSRVIALDDARSIYSFVLTPPPVPLEQLEGALDAQDGILHEELKKLKHLLEN